MSIYSRTLDTVPYYSYLQSEDETLLRSINKRECVVFVSADGTQHAKTLCECGLTRDAHPTSSYTHAQCDQPWRYSTHTQHSPTDAFGRIEFVGFREKFANYIRLDVDTSPDTIIHLLTKVWHIHPPDMLISISEGAKSFNLKPRLKFVFRNGLRKITKSNSAWVLSGGIRLRLVGEAVSDIDSVTQKSVAIGIAPWGCVQGRECLVNEKKEGENAQYRMESEIPDEILLDPNHQHFIFVDDGTTHTFGTEMSLRTTLEEAVSSSMSTASGGSSEFIAIVSSSMSTASGGSSMQGVKVPTVLVVLGGGPSELENVYMAVQKGIPAVIVEGSGGAADILTYAYLNAHEEGIVVTDQSGNEFTRTIMGLAADVEADISDRIHEAFGPHNLTTAVGWVKEAIHKYDLLTVFRYQKDDEMDLSILHALLKANKGQPLMQLHLALTWNRIDVAKSEIFNDEREWKTTELNDAMLSALLLDRVDFVELFLDSGVSLKQFLTIDVLLTLYNQIHKKSLLHALLWKVKREKHRHFFTLEDVGRLIKLLMGDFYEPLYLAVPGLRNAIPFDVLAGTGPGEVVEDEEGTLINRPERELFVWSLLMNRPDMALFFWNVGQDALCAAMFAHKLLHSMAEKTVDTDLKSFTQRHSDSYAELALGVLTACHNDNETQATELLMRKLNYWGKVTCLDIAVEANNKQFIAHPATQSILNAIWYGNISHHNSFVMIVLATVFPPFLFALRYVRTPGESHVDQHDEQEMYTNMPASPKSPTPSSPTYKTHEKEDGIRVANGNIGMDPRAPTLSRCQSYKRPSKSSNTKNGVVQKMAYFFMAPVVRFNLNVIFYMLFLLLYSHHLLPTDLLHALPAPVQPSPIALPTDLLHALQAPVQSSPIALLQIFYMLFLLLYSHHLSLLQIFYMLFLLLYIHHLSLLQIFYMLFLLLYSHHLLLELHPSNEPKLKEKMLMFWVFTICLEEIRQLLSGCGKTTLRSKLKNYINDYWNIADLVTIILFITGLVFRFLCHHSVGDPQTCEAARVIFGFNIMTFYVRLLHIFSVNKHLGPKLVMIGKMVQDLLYFLSILVVFIISFGIGYHSLREHNTETITEMIRSILDVSYFGIFGDLHLEELGERADNIRVEMTMRAFLGLYLLLINVLLLNLVIAMFSYTFTMVQENTDLHWHFQRYSIIHEYYEKPFFPPPFILISHAKRLVVYAVKRWRVMRTESKNSIDFSQEDNKDAISVWEDASRDDYNRNKLDKETKSVEYQVALTSEKVNEIHELINATTDSTTVVSSGKTNEVLEQRIKQMEENVNAKLDYIMKALVDNNLAAKTDAPPTLTTSTMAAEEEAAREREIAKEMIERRLELHVRSRSSPYPSCHVTRFHVPDDKVPWETSFPSYHPVNYTATAVLNRPDWADHLDLLQIDTAHRPLLVWNNYDENLGIDRRVYGGEYTIKDGLPINPHGRTGIVGRGLLGRWGPNHSAEPIVTRWKRDSQGNKMMEGGKPLLEFAVIQRQDNKLWSFPGGFCAPSQNVSDTLKEEFWEEALAGGTESVVGQEKLEELFSRGEEVFRGYADDPRNTDNAWIETRAVHYHDDSGDTLQHIKFRAGLTEIGVTWLTASSNITMHSSHSYYMQKVVAKLDCAF